MNAAGPSVSETPVERRLRHRTAAVGTLKGVVLIRRTTRGTKVRRYNWHSAGSLGGQFPMLKYKYLFQIKYTEAILSAKLLRLEIVDDRS